jgi:phosphatidylinositol glycan class Z
MGSKTFKWQYAGAVALRLAQMWSSGYIHPDEYFQAQEVAAIRRYKLDVPVPWEFDSRYPCRSAVLPLTAATLPYAAVDMLGLGRSAIGSRAMLLAPRIMMCLASFLLDWAAFRLAPLCGTSSQIAVLCLATSWPVLLLHLRPFSNTFESLILAVLLVLWLAPPRPLPRFAVGLASGVLMGVGVFFRFTLLFYSLPLLIASFLGALQDIAGPFSKLPVVMKRIHGQGTTQPPVLFVVLGFLLSSGGLVEMDSHYFATNRANNNVTTTCTLLGHPRVLTPLNSLLYNMKADNLAHHGLHPRFTHLLVNFPMLFGPLALLAVASALSALVSRPRGVKGAGVAASRASTRGERGGRGSSAETDTPWARSCVAACGSCGLMFLSLAPHQEPRFLLPLCLPMALLFAPFLDVPASCPYAAATGGRDPCADAPPPNAAASTSHEHPHTGGGESGTSNRSRASASASPKSHNKKVGLLARSPAAKSPRGTQHQGPRGKSPGPATAVVAGNARGSSLTGYLIDVCT